MSDILLAFGASGSDMRMAEGDLLCDDSLLTAVIISLFTDRLAAPDDRLPAEADDRRGWWADATLQGGKDNIGSRLWLLGRESTTPDVPERARAYAAEALQWLVDEGRATGVQVDARRLHAADSSAELLLTVAIDAPQGGTYAFVYNPVTSTYTFA
jgi:phage gp46-like protein